MRRPAVLVAILGAAAVVLRRSKAQKAEQALWTEAAQEVVPDLR